MMNIIYFFVGKQKFNRIESSFTEIIPSVQVCVWCCTHVKFLFTSFMYPFKTERIIDSFFRASRLLCIIFQSIKLNEGGFVFFLNKGIPISLLRTFSQGCMYN